MDRHLYLRLEPSKILQTYQVLLLVLCGWAIALCGLNVWIKLVLSIGTVIVFWRHFTACRYPFVVGISVEQGEWQLETATGFQPVRLLVGSAVTYSLTVLRFQCVHGKHASVVVLPDSGDAERLRQLRVLLLNSPDGSSSVFPRANRE